MFRFKAEPVKETVEKLSHALSHNVAVVDDFVKCEDCGCDALDTWKTECPFYRKY